MSMALPYDSDEGRDVAAAVTALMCGEGVRAVGAAWRKEWERFQLRGEREPMLEVIRMHREAMRGIKPDTCRRSCTWRAGRMGRGAGTGREAWLQELAGDGAGADGHDRFHDGLPDNDQKNNPPQGKK